MWEVVAEKLALSNPPIPVGQIDASKYPEVRVKHEIRANPTIKLFIDEEAFEFPLEEERTWANIVNWINERTNREQVVSDAEEMDVFLDENPLAIVGLFISERDSEMFKKTSRHFDDVSFAVTYGSNSREMAQYLVKQGCLLNF
ncbi:conserved hypothetical protein [Perkinsus marinus ATCC 50983]|uniref:Uncharacterized protein n=1 Tax=Perkinsus marinus (strain ATCC 50983 / TXsc) TaxID=423536 RepID=C5L781_PERM5|nr:conserved hypothetical protein [Perkinsus marinus ATCC 50983]EER07343.1 conserved hypothetical protein [Perkinsus marinus ATCC 50983]|eukprot:XP_002775527.1 conserved hypothetical protein [Perkinsus marinus ATCC 50983]